MELFIYLLNFISLIKLIDARGSMLEPPQRSSLWRVRPWKKDKTIPKNLEDYGLNCGGFWHHHGINKGQCGVCGDPYDSVYRNNEAGGRYANGIIVRKYRQHRKFINVTIDITSNIGGYFEFRICPHDNLSAVVTQECLDKHQLVIHDHGLKFYPKDDRKYNLALEMPQEVTCEQCVLQWKWRGSYNWGRCGDGYQDIGCGNQEEYYNCADIAILPSKRKRKPHTTEEPTTSTTPSSPTDQWNQIVNKEVITGTVQTIPTQIDVKTMNKDVIDIQTIDTIYDPYKNLVDGHVGQVQSGMSGIPVFIVPTGSTLPPPKINVPTIAPGFVDRINEATTMPTTLPPPIVEPVTLPLPPTVKPEVKDNTIYDITSVKINDGVKQDLVQSPGNNIFMKADWVEGTVSRDLNVRLRNASASGDGTASASVTNTNQSLLTALNVTDISLPIDMTTLDPLSMNINKNLLRNMFYSAAPTSRLEAELESLLPMNIFPFNLLTGNQPTFADPGDQFMRAMYALTKDNTTTEAIDQLLLSQIEPTVLSTINVDPTPSESGFLAPTTMLAKLYRNNENVLPKIVPTKVSKINHAILHKRLTSRIKPTIETVQAQQKRPSIEILKEKKLSVTSTPETRTIKSDQWNEMLQSMNSLLNNLYTKLDDIVHTANQKPEGTQRGSKSLSGQNQIPVGDQASSKAKLLDGVVVSGVKKASLPSESKQETGSKILSDRISDMTSHSINSNPANQIISSPNEQISQNSQIVISDPKTKFSFRDLDARNVEKVRGQNIGQDSIQSNTLQVMDQSNNIDITRSSLNKQGVTDITHSSLNKRFVNDNMVSTKSELIKDNTAELRANSLLLEKMLGRLKSGILISNSKNTQPTASTADIKPVSKEKMKNALETLYRGKTKEKNKEFNVWDEATKMKGTSKKINVWDLATKRAESKQNTMPTGFPDSFIAPGLDSFLRNGILVYPDVSPTQSLNTLSTSGIQGSKTSFGPPQGLSIGTSQIQDLTNFNTVTDSMLGVMSNLWNSQTTVSPLFHGPIIV